MITALLFYIAVILTKILIAVAYKQGVVQE